MRDAALVSLLMAIWIYVIIGLKILSDFTEKRMRLPTMWEFFSWPSNFKQSTDTASWNAIAVVGHIFTFLTIIFIWFSYKNGTLFAPFQLGKRDSRILLMAVLVLAWFSFSIKRAAELRIKSTELNFYRTLFSYRALNKHDRRLAIVIDVISIILLSMVVAIALIF